MTNRSRSHVLYTGVTGGLVRRVFQHKNRLIEESPAASLCPNRLPRESANQDCSRLQGVRPRRRIFLQIDAPSSPGRGEVL